MRLIDADALKRNYGQFNHNAGGKRYCDQDIDACPTVDAEPVVRCRDCKHKPTVPQWYENGFDIEFPDNICPCQCDDKWYSWCPDDNWFCGSGEPKEEDK